MISTQIINFIPMYHELRFQISKNFTTKGHYINSRMLLNWKRENDRKSYLNEEFSPKDLKNRPPKTLGRSFWVKTPKLIKISLKYCPATTVTINFLAWIVFNFGHNFLLQMRINDRSDALKNTQIYLIWWILGPISFLYSNRYAHLKLSLIYT